MSETTPGQLVYETGHRGYAVDEDWSPTPWAELTAAEHADWEAAAKAATVTAWRLLDEARAERDKLRALVREILREVELGTLGQHTPAATTRTLARTAEWRQRARVEG